MEKPMRFLDPDPTLVLGLLLNGVIPGAGRCGTCLELNYFDTSSAKEVILPS